MLLAALVAFVGTLIAFAGVTALVRGWFEMREGFLLACTVALLGLTAGLGAATIMLVLDFQAELFRAYQVGVSLLAMLWLALGVVEMMARTVPSVFGTRLLVVAFSIVAGTILVADPLRDVDDVSNLPSVDQLYLPLPSTLVAVAHVLVAIIISASFLTVALRAGRGEGVASQTFMSCLLMLLATLFVFVAVRPELVGLPPMVYMALLSAAAGGIWVAAVRAMRATDEDSEDSDADEWQREEEDEDESFWSEGPRRRQAEPSPQDDVQGSGEPAASPLPDEQPLAASPEAGTGPMEAQLASQAGSTEHAGPDLSDPAEDACGFIVIFTLREGAARPFDRLAEATVEAIQAREPGTLLYTCHTVADAPQQRIFYELYRNRAAMQEHERQPHVQRFISEREEYVLATNVVRLTLNTGLPAAHSMAAERSRTQSPQ